LSSKKELAMKLKIALLGCEGAENWKPAKQNTKRSKRKARKKLRCEGEYFKENDRPKELELGWILFLNLKAVKP
jgi:hypothetical protein